MPGQPIFAIFEGGGAKGVAHVGAVAACEDLGFRIMGAAGASAGAIVATLVAAGFSSKDILDAEEDGQNIIHRHGLTVPKLLGPTDWRRFNRLRKRRIWLMVSIGAVGVLAGLAASPRALGTLIHTWRGKGRLSTAALEDFVNARLRDRLAAVWAAHDIKDPVPDRVTFAHLNYAKFEEFKPLKIVATDVTTRELCIFSQATTPSIEVARAVAASIAIPLVFKPVTLTRKGKVGVYVDGGLVSNLPVWIFANEKRAVERKFFRKPPVPVVGFTLRDPRPRPARKHLIGFLQDVLETALSGSQSIAEDFMADLTVVRLPCELELLDFDASPRRMHAAFKAGRDAAFEELQWQLVTKPANVRAELKRIFDRVRPVIRAKLGVQDDRDWIFRAGIIEPVGPVTEDDGEVPVTDADGYKIVEDEFRVTYAHNMDEDADDRLPLDGRGRASPFAFRSKEMQLTEFGEAYSDPDRDYMTKYERALAHPDLHSIIATPIFESETAWEQSDPAKRTQPCGVFAVDSNRDLAPAFDDPDILRLLATQSTLLFGPLTQELPRVERP